MRAAIEPPAEFVLAAACCMWPPSETRNQTIKAASQIAIDWKKFFRVVKRQRVPGLVHTALKSAGIGPPVEIANELSRSAHQIAVQNLQFAAEAYRLQKLFDNAGIRIVFLKGTSLAQLAYRSLAQKHGKDIDLLVPPDCAATALQLLEREGYALWLPAGLLSEAQRRAVIKYSKEVALIHRNTQVQVELHWRLTNNSLLLKNLDARSPTQDVAVSSGIRIRTFLLDDLFAYLGVHGAVHGWSRLKWLADFNALIGHESEAEVERLYRAAQMRGAGLCAGQALLLSCRLLGLKLRPALKAELQGSRRLDRLVAIALHAMIGEDAETEFEEVPFATTHHKLMQFLIGQGWLYAIIQLRIVSTSVYDTIAFPLPARLHFLYPVLRLPLWVWRRAHDFGRSHRSAEPMRRP